MAQNDNSEIAPIGLFNFRGKGKKFGIKLDDRRRHVYVVGKTGVGKTTLLENMVISDLQAGRGVGIVDPHGEFAEKMLDFVPEDRLDDVIYFNPADMDHPIAFNPMERVGTEFRHLVASGLMGVFKKIFVDVWSARMAYILNNTLLALLELPGSNLLGIMRMLSEPNYRKKIVENVQDPVVKAFWVNEFARYSQRLETEAVAAIQNKIGQFVSNPLIRNVLGQSHSSINMREIMDGKKIFIANMSKGKIGEDNSALLGAMIITRLQLAAMSRVDIPEEKREDFFLYVDEFQNFATDSFANILSEARKYRLSLILAHQYIGQLIHENNTKVRDAVFGNVGTIICFRVGGADAEFLEKEFMPEFLQQDLVNLSKANIYLKLMVDGVTSRPFSSETIAPPKLPLITYKDDIISMSRDKYSTPRSVVEKMIAAEWQTKSDEVIEEKKERRGERSLGEVFGRGGGNAGQGFGGSRGGGEPRREWTATLRGGESNYQHPSFDGSPRKEWPTVSRDEPRRESPATPPGEPRKDRWTDQKDERRAPQFNRDNAPPRDEPRAPHFERDDAVPKQATPMSSSRHFEKKETNWSASPMMPQANFNKPKIEHPKLNVNIDDLRKAISASLGKDVDVEEKPAHNRIEPPMVPARRSLGEGVNKIEPPPIRHRKEPAENDSNHDDINDNGDKIEKPFTTSGVEPLYGTDEDREDVSDEISLEELAEKEEKGVSGDSENNYDGGRGDENG